MSRDTLQTGSSARYVRHVPGGEGTLVGDGCPLESGFGFIAGNNVSHLRGESLRHLVSSLGPGSLTANKDGWSDLGGDVPPASARTSTVEQIAWGISTAQCYGPFPAIADDAQRAAGRDDLERAVKMYAMCKSDGTHSLTLYFAATVDRRPPTEGYASFSTATTTSSSVVELTHVGALYPLGYPRAYIAGASTDPGGGLVTVPEFYLWCGWLLAAGGTGALCSISAWEIST